MHLISFFPLSSDLALSRLLYCVRSAILDKIEQSLRRKLDLDLFRHLHSLSLRWHLAKKAGEVISVITNGARSIDMVL